MTWKFEHGVDYAVPAEKIEAAGLVDTSWHNDVCPSFAITLEDPVTHDIHDLRLWVEHTDPERREYEGPRYAINYQPWSSEPVPGVQVSDEGDLYRGDDLDEALAAYREAADRIRTELARRTR